MYQLKTISRAIALLGMTGGLLQAAWADDTSTTDDQKKQEKIEVTGSNIKRINAETAAPVQVITRKDIQAQGVTSVTDLISNLSAATGNSTISDVTGGGGFAPGSSSVGLRNLGESATLVLLNGRRVAPNALADFSSQFTNTDAFPINAVERVEVLKSGAAAIYGSDAVAGVINIITRKDYTGVEASVDRSQSITSGGFGTTNASITAGMGNLESDRYNIFVNLNTYHRDGEMWEPYLGYQNPKLIKASGSNYGATSNVAYPGNIFDQDNSNNIGNLGCKGPRQSLVGGLCLFDNVSQYQAVPKSNRVQGYLAGQFQISSDVTLFSELSYSDQKTQYTGPSFQYSTATPLISWANPSTNTPQTFNYMGLNGQNSLNPFQSDNSAISVRFTDVPNIHNNDNTQNRILAGLRGNYHGQDWESAVGIMTSRSTDIMSGSNPSFSAWNQYIGCVSSASCGTPDGTSGLMISNDPNYFHQPGGYVLGGPNSPSILNALFPQIVTTAKYEQTFWDGKISGDILDLKAGALSYAAGAELRHENYLLSESANQLDGDVVGFGSSVANGERTYGALFGELSVPIFKSLEADVAARADKFPHFDAHISPKLGVKWTPFDSLAFRGTVEGGFRAPNLIESANSTFTSFSPANVSDPSRCPAALQLQQALQAAINATTDPVQLSLLQARVQEAQKECAGSPVAITKGNPNLKPETSHSFTLGVVFEPIKGFSGSIDYWQIVRGNSITQLAPQQIVNLQYAGKLPAGGALGLSRYPFSTQSDPTFQQNDTLLGGNDFTQFNVPAVGQIQSVTSTFENSYEVKTNGIDLNLRGKWKTASLGTFDFDWNGTYLIGYHDASLASLSDNLAGDYAGGVSPMPRFVSDLTIGDTYGPHHGGFRINYTSGIGLQNYTGDPTWGLQGCLSQGVTADLCHVPSQTFVDAFYDYTGVKNLTVAVHVSNIFARHLAANIESFGVAAQVPSVIADAQGRMLNVSLSYKFF